MGDRTVVYDSEEEDDGFSPLNSPIKGYTSEVGLTAEHNHEGQTVETHMEGSRSTDPDFFKRIYEEQQKAMTDSVPNSVRDTQAQDGFSDKRKSSDTRAKNSSSITDPTLKSAEKKTAQTDAKDFDKLTQITTPSALGAKPKDVYDFSLSDEEEADEGSAMLKEKVSPKRATLSSKSKRKRDQSANPVAPATGSRSSPPQVSISSFDSPGLPTKKRKVARDQSMRLVPDDVDLLSTSQNMSEAYDELNVEHGGFDSIVPGTHVAQTGSHAHPPASYFIAPPVTLTSSQKKEYLRVSDSEFDREDDREDQHQMIGLPEPNAGQRSTNASLSTIAYTTPSRFASSVEPLPILGPSDGPSSNAATSSGRRIQVDKRHPLSSPDELNANPTARTTRGKKYISTLDEEDELAQHDSWDSDKIGNSRETCVSRTARRRSGNSHDHLGDTHVEINTSTSEKQRPGRGAKAETMLAHSGDSDNVDFPSEHYVPRPSTRRSRVSSDKQQEEQRAEDCMPDTCPPGDARYENPNDVDPVAILSEWQEADQVTGAVAGADPEVWAALPDDIRKELVAEEQSARTLQASRTRRRGRGAEAASNLEPFAEGIPQPKKRGRKKQVKSIEEASVVFEETAAAFEETQEIPSPAPTAAAKRKRGRPRKAEAAPPATTTEEPFNLMDAPERLVVDNEESNDTSPLPVKAPADSDVTKAPAKRGRKKKAAEAPSPYLQGLGEENAHLEEDGDDFDEFTGKRAVEPLESAVDPPTISIEIEDRPALRDISSSASNMSLKRDSTMDHVAEKLPTDEAEQLEEVTPEPKAKEVAKSASTPGQQGKVPLRVGLSKKSRIAPLLKIIRK